MDHLSSLEEFKKIIYPGQESITVHPSALEKIGEWPPSPEVDLVAGKVAGVSVLTDDRLPSHLVTARKPVLRSLDGFNTERRKVYGEVPGVRRRGNGIACPACGGELADDGDGSVYLSHPPKVGVSCRCGYRGYRIK